VFIIGWIISPYRQVTDLLLIHRTFSIVQHNYSFLNEYAWKQSAIDLHLWSKTVFIQFRYAPYPNLLRPSAGTASGWIRGVSVVSPRWVRVILTKTTFTWWPDYPNTYTQVWIKLESDTNSSRIVTENSPNTRTRLPETRSFEVNNRPISSNHTKSQYNGIIFEKKSINQLANYTK